MSAFFVEARTVEGWQRVATGTTIGHKRILPTPLTKATSLRAHDRRVHRHAGDRANRAREDRRPLSAARRRCRASSGTNRAQDTAWPARIRVHFHRSRLLHDHPSSTRAVGLAAGILGASIVIAQERTRATVPDQYKWNLAELYPGDEAWQAERTRIEQDLPKARAFKGTLGQSAAQLQKALDLNAEQDKALSRLATYAGLKADEDTRLSNYQGMRDQVIQLGRRKARSGRTSSPRS